MKKLLLTCFLALGIGTSAQYNYVGDFEGDASLYGQFGTGTITAAAACSGVLGGQITATSATPQTGWMMQLDVLQEMQPTQTNNSQAATVTIRYKKASGPVGQIIPMLFIYDDASDQWSLVQIGDAVSLTSAAVTNCSTITGTIPSGVMQSGKVYAVGAWYVRSSGSGNVYMDDISIVQDVVTTAPACTSITSPVGGSTIGYGNADITWTAAPTATSYALTVGTTSGASDVYNGVITGGVTDQFVPLAANTTYYAKVIPSNANGSATGCTEISFSTNNTISYCTATSPVYTNTGYEIISNVVFADISKTSPTTANTPGYEDYTATVGHVKQGISYPMTVTVKGYDSSGPDKTTVWIDFNHNGSFEDATEKFALTSTASATGTITIPSDAVLGDTRMRISMTYQDDPVSCGTNLYGQVQDYTVNISQLVIPSCTTITAPADAATGISAPSATLTWNSDSNATGYKVYVGTTNGGTDVVNGTVVTATTLALSGLNRNTTYYAKVVPTNSLGDATGCTGTSFTTGADWTYCVATHTTINADRISNVSMADINNPGATTATGGYEDFTAVVGNVEANGSYPIAITAASGNASDKVKVWIDSNQNGTFEDSEATLLNYVSTTSTTGTINIPSDATLGSTRMRIRLARQSSATAVVACGNIAAQGRTQDYTLNIVAAGSLATSNVNKTSFSVYPNPFQDILNISDVKGVKSISVNDASGRQIRNLAPSAQLNLSGLKSGLYLVNLHMEDGSVKTIKAIKK